MTKITAGPSHSSRYTSPVAAGSEAELRERLRTLLEGLSPENGDLLAAFHRIQHEYGYVPREALPVLAVQFRTTPAMLYGALDFYSEIRTSPPPRTTVEWCSGPACLLAGSLNIRRALEAVLGCAMNENSADGQFGLQLVQCDGTCHLAPLVRHEGRYLGPLSVSAAISLARGLKGEPEPPGPPEPAPEAAPNEEEEA